MLNFTSLELGKVITEEDIQELKLEGLRQRFDGDTSQLIAMFNEFKDKSDPQEVDWFEKMEDIDINYFKEGKTLKDAVKELKNLDFSKDYYRKERSSFSDVYRSYSLEEVLEIINKEEQALADYYYRVYADWEDIRYCLEQNNVVTKDLLEAVAEF